MSLDLKEYLMSRDCLYPAEWTPQRYANAVDLLKRVNNLLTSLEIKDARISSGWRPVAVNAAVGGAKKSLHMEGKAVDIKDPGGLLKMKVLDKPEKLMEFGLWMEEPSSTPGWMHLDTGLRTARPIRIFKP